MARRRSWAKSCRGKIRYRSHAEAVRALHKQQNRGVVIERAYACSCKGWHLTSQKGPSRG